MTTLSRNSGIDVRPWTSYPRACPRTSPRACLRTSHVRQLARQVAVDVENKVQLPAHAQVCLLAVQAVQLVVAMA